MRRSWKITAVAGLGLAAASLVAWASDKGQLAPADSLDLPTLMQAKLVSSQKITEGLVTKDFELIRRGAEEWRRIAAATKWASRSDPVFAQHRAEFSRQADRLLRTADEKDLDAAAYTYIRSLTTCISCHEYCRDVLHVPAIGRNPKAVSPIPVTDEDVGSPAQSGARR